MVAPLVAAGVAITAAEIGIKAWPEIEKAIGFGIEELPKLIKAGQNLSAVIRAHSDEPKSFLSDLKVVSAKLHKIVDTMTVDKTAEGSARVVNLVKKLQKLDAILGKDSLSPKQVKNAYATASSVAKVIIKIAGDIDNSDLKAIGGVAVDLVGDAKAIGTILIKDLKHLKTTFKNKVGPKLDKAKIKLEKVGDKMKIELSDKAKEIKSHFKEIASKAKPEKLEKLFNKLTDKLHKHKVDKSDLSHDKDDMTVPMTPNNSMVMDDDVSGQLPTHSDSALIIAELVSTPTSFESTDL